MKHRRSKRRIASGFAGKVREMNKSSMAGGVGLLTAAVACAAVAAVQVIRGAWCMVSAPFIGLVAAHVAAASLGAVVMDRAHGAPEAPGEEESS